MRLLINSGSRAKIPSSRKRFFSRVAPFDIAWAGVSPIFAFIIRDGSINRVDSVVIYCAVALIVSTIVFQWFKISSPIPSFFSVHDAFAVTKACLTAASLTAAVIFIFTRLDYAPRSIPVIHFLVLGTGLIGTRAVSRMIGTRNSAADIQPRCEDLENILIIGATRLAWFFSRMVDEFASHERRILGVLDERRSLHNRTLNGYSILGSPENLKKLIDEYSIHGVEIKKVIVAAHPKEFSGANWIKVRETCKQKNIAIEWLHERFSSSYATRLPSAETIIPDRGFPATWTSWSIWDTKRLIDIALTIVMMLGIAPLAILVAILVFIDVGFPIVFWQQRIGYLGRPLHVYKFRTMRNSFDRESYPIPESERLSQLGQLLRRSHLDEIPQLFNILAGDMALIGPRPLLPVDQPKKVYTRLLVRPGLTGLAQISGGTLLSPDEKDDLDTWYVQHATVLLDIKIILRTIWVIIRGHRRNDVTISTAAADRNAAPEPAQFRPAGKRRGRPGAPKAFKRSKAFKL